MESREIAAVVLAVAIGVATIFRVLHFFSMWLSPEIFDWQAEAMGWRDTSASADVRRGYELWEHANQILDTTGAAELARADALTTLKRCIDYRLKTLATVYQLSKMPIKLNGRVLEHLREFGLVRPLMIRKLFELRNFIEHQNAQAPSVDVCRELSEFAWYFLRSTDRFSLQVVSDVAIRPTLSGDSAYWLQAVYEPQGQWTIAVHGIVPSSYVRAADSGGWIEIDTTRIETMGDCWRREGRLGLPFKRADPEPEDFVFAAAVKGPATQLRAFYCLYFRC